MAQALSERRCGFRGWRKLCLKGSRGSGKLQRPDSMLYRKLSVASQLTSRREGPVLCQGWRLLRRQVHDLQSRVVRDPGPECLKYFQGPSACGRFPGRILLSTVWSLKKCYPKGENTALFGSGRKSLGWRGFLCAVGAGHCAWQQITLVLVLSILFALLAQTFRAGKWRWSLRTTI